MSEHTSSTLSKYELVCGMEVHAELKTKSKMFCGCKNDPFRASQPNIYTCPVCLGMPGGLPVANKKAIEWTIKLGLALGCKINLFSHFDRKNYFYPDLPKGYQISQYDQPFCIDGVVETDLGPVRIHRIHLEEDTAKLQHKTVDGQKVSLIDFNRSSVPLVEIVTEADIHSAEHAKAYTKKLRQIIRFLDIADCDMEQGGMRLEANTSLRHPGETNLPQYKVEVKNINSFRFLEKAINFEIKRQSEILDAGEVPAQETRGWSDDKGQTFTQRAKEDAEEYRYFPDPDLPPIRFEQKQIDEIKDSLPELPDKIIKRWFADFDVETKNSDLLIESQDDAKWFEELFVEAKKAGVQPNALANAVVNKKLIIAEPRQIAQTIKTFQQANQTDTVDEAELQKIIAEVIAANPDAVAQFKNGKTNVIGFFMGQVMRKSGKKLDVKQLNASILKTLSSGQ